MKKKIILLILVIFICAACFSDNIVFTLSSGQKRSTLTTNINADGAVYITSLSRTGEFIEMKVPPFPSYSNGKVYVGELRKGGLFRFLSDPADTEFLHYCNEHSFQKVNNPGLVPSLSGTAWIFPNSAVGIFTPVLNPASPSGSYVELGNERMFGNILWLHVRDSESSNYTEDWHSRINGGDTFSGLIGFNESLKLGNMEFETFSFILGEYNLNTGYSGAFGWNIDFENRNMKVKVHNRILNLGSGKPSEIIGYSVRVGSDILLTFGYEFSKYRPPVFGGTSQRKGVEFTTKLEMQNINYSCLYCINSDSDTGVSCTSEYELSIDDILFSGDLLKVSGYIKLDRSDISITLLNSMKYEISDDVFTLNLDGKKVRLSMSLNLDERMKITVNQDRQITLTLRKELY